MKKRIFLTLIIGFVINSLFSQKKNVNWTILIDNNIEMLSNAKIVMKNSNDEIEIFNVNLIPGDLIISELDYKKILKVSH